VPVDLFVRRFVYYSFCSGRGGLPLPTLPGLPRPSGTFRPGEVSFSPPQDLDCFSRAASYSLGFFLAFPTVLFALWPLPRTRSFFRCPASSPFTLFFKSTLSGISLWKCCPCHLWCFEVSFSAFVVSPLPRHLRAWFSRFFSVLWTCVAAWRL